MKTFYSLLILMALIMPMQIAALDLELVVDILKDDTLEVDVPSGSDTDGFKTDEIYAIYERKMEIDGVVRYTGYVDSVYLHKVDRYKLVFAYLWSGAKRNIREGYFLVRTHVPFIKKEKSLTPLIESAR